jgi:hypothetical protein
VSFQEKSAMAMTGALAVVYGACFAIVGRWLTVTLRGERVGGYVLAVGVFGGLVLAMAELAPFYIAHALLLAWVLAALVEGATKIALYRRGT